MVKRLSYNSLLLGALAVLSACSGSGDVSVDISPPTPLQEWVAKVTAEQDSITCVSEDTGKDNSNRAAFIGGNTDRFSTTWDKGDVVMVYKGETYVGDMNPLSSFYGTTTADLTGTLTGSFAVNDVLSLYSPSKAIDLTGQTGTLQSMSSKTYRTKNTTITEANNNILSLSGINMSHRLGYARFYLTDYDTGERLHPSRLELHGINGNPVLTMDENGNVTSTGDIVVNTAKFEGEYPGELYVAMLNENDAKVTYQIKAIVDGETYVGPCTGQNAYAPGLSKGTLGNCKRKLRKTTPVSSLVVSSVANRTFTGYAQEPTGMTVRDGATTLTAGTDYAFEYSSNVNVGEATVVVRGLADAGATCATKYLGTQDVHFNITKATPKIQMNTSTLELGYGASSETRTVSRVYIDNNNNDTYEAAIDYDITSQCTVNYVSNNTGVCTVNTSGQVTPVGSGSTTITVQVYAAANWNSVSTYYPVTVVAGVRNGNAVGNWSDGGSTPGKVYVE